MKWEQVHLEPLPESFVDSFTPFCKECGNIWWDVELWEAEERTPAGWAAYHRYVIHPCGHNSGILMRRLWPGPLELVP